MIASVVVWFVGQILIEGYGGVDLTGIFAFQPGQVLFEYSIWQVVTYIFLHSATQVNHILFNMLMLWFMGAELETRWGSKAFAAYYIINGAGAAVIYLIGVALYAAVTGHQRALMVPVVGASGSLFALMMAYGWLFGERTIYFLMMFPMKAKYFVMLLGGVQLASLLTTGIVGSEVAHLAHLGGLLSGALYIFIWGYYRTRMVSNKNRKKSPNLRLVVNNESSEEKKGPKYWN